jgi:hypothetical protein
MLESLATEIPSHEPTRFLDHAYSDDLPLVSTSASTFRGLIEFIGHGLTDS